MKLSWVLAMTVAVSGLAFANNDKDTGGMKGEKLDTHCLDKNGLHENIKGRQERAERELQCRIAHGESGGNVRDGKAQADRVAHEHHRDHQGDGGH